MSKITARYVDTCLSDYLQDGYSRPGQCLAFSSLGMSVEDTVEFLAGSVDTMLADAGCPESIETDDIRAALREAIEGVDLRYIDEEGNRQDEPAEDRDGDEPYLYVVLEWTPSKVVRFKVDAEIDVMVSPEYELDIKAAIEALIANGVGSVVDGTDGEVVSWGATAVPGEPEPACWNSVPQGWQCSKCGEIRREPYKNPHPCK